MDKKELREQNLLLRSLLNAFILAFDEEVGTEELKGKGPILTMDDGRLQDTPIAIVETSINALVWCQETNPMSDKDMDVSNNLMAQCACVVNFTEED